MADVGERRMGHAGFQHVQSFVLLQDKPLPAYPWISADFAVF